MNANFKHEGLREMGSAAPTGSPAEDRPPPRGRVGRVLVGSACAAVLAIACDSGVDPDGAGPLSAVVIAPTNPQVEIESTLQLEVTLVNADGEPVEGRLVFWSSEDSTIAHVSRSTGLVTGRSVGSTRIAASAEGVNAITNVTVVPLGVAAVTVSPEKRVVEVGRSATFQSVARDRNDAIVNGRPVAWTTGTAQVATIDSNGRVTGVAVGTTEVRASIDGKVGTATVEVVPVPVSAVEIEPSSEFLTVGGTRQFTATAKDASGGTLSGRAVDWSSSNSGVATVSPNGLVEGKATGTAKIKATIEGKSAEATVTVLPVTVASVGVQPTSANLTVGGTRAFSATPRDDKGNPLGGRSVSWSSSDISVVSVSPAGLATAVGPGSAKITATVEGKSSEATVTVAAVPVATVTISPSTADMTVGASHQFTATPKDAGGNVLEGRAVAWASSNSAVVSVDDAGLARAFAPGTAKITATVEGKSSEATVTVTAVPVATVTVSPSKAELTVGASHQFTATPKDAGGNELEGRTITWSSSNSAVVTIDATGLAQAIAPGAARITALVEGRSAGADVTVSVVPVETVEISPSSAEIVVLGSRQFTVVLKSADGTVLSGRDVTWSSDQPSIASVNSSGLVTGLIPGIAMITAASEGRNASATVEVVAPPSGATSLIIISGNDQSGENNQPLEQPLVVRLLDGQDQPVAGAEVRWSASNGKLSASKVITDGDGYASVYWTLGGGGDKTRTAWAEVNGLPRVEFTAHKTN